MGDQNDFRKPQLQTDVKKVLAAVAIAVQRMNTHPECGVAAWLMSKVATDEDYQKAGEAALLQKSEAALQDEACASVTQEYSRGGSIWHTKIVLLNEYIN